MATSTVASSPTVSFDPIRFCVYSTVALLAWIVSPPVMVMAMSGLGLWAYARAVRAGLTRSKCVLRNPKLVLLYLGTIFAAGAVGFGFEVARVVQRLS
jgi:hypothetical protein